MIIHGIATCDTCRRARKALGDRATWRDIRKEPLTEGEIAEVVATFGNGAINRSSTTWRGLDEAERTLPAAELLLRHPTLMKRPLIRDGDTLHLGWNNETAALTGSSRG